MALPSITLKSGGRFRLPLWMRRSPKPRTKSILRDTYLPYHTYMVQNGKPVWSPREYPSFAKEGFEQNVIVYQAISKLANAVASVPWKLFDTASNSVVTEHPLIRLLRQPSPDMHGTQFFHNLIGYRLISGNAYILKVGAQGERAPSELYLLRPDRMQVIAGANMLPAGYRYTVDNHYTDYPVHRVSGECAVLHLKAFHPLNDWYGLSPIEAAAYSIDQHNQAGEWNQALLQNGARPSGALVVKAGEGNAGGTLSDDQYQRLKHQIDDQYSGGGNAGRPLLLEGGLDWREMSISPRDMDFIQTKHSSARDISLAFGVPPQLLGIPGDNTYSNLAEARLAFWEQTVIPLLDTVRDALNGWLIPLYAHPLELRYDIEGVSALSPRREQLWDRLKDCDFLTPDEKRAMVGLGPLDV